MGEIDKRYPLAVFGFGLGAHAVAVARAGAQFLDDNQLHPTLALYAYGFAVGAFFGGAPARDNGERAERWAFAIAAWLAPIGSALWLRLPPGLSTGDRAVVCALPLLALPAAASGFAVARRRFAARTGFALWLASAGIGAAAAAGPGMRALGLPLTMAQACLVIALAALQVTRAAPNHAAARVASGAAFLTALALAVVSQRAFAIPDQATPFGPAAFDERVLRDEQLTLRARADAWDGHGHTQEFAIVRSQKALPLGVLFRDSHPFAPLAIEPGSAPSCAGSLLGTAFGNKPGRVLLAGVGGGAELLCAIELGAERIDVAEESHALASMLRERIERLPGRIRFYDASARSVARRAREKYDRIVLAALRRKHRLPAAALPILDALLETDRAFAELLRALADGGALYVVTNDEPSALRVVTTALSALRMTGESKPENQIVVHESHGSYLVRVQRTPFTLDQILALHAAQRQRAEPLSAARDARLDVALFGGLFGNPQLAYTPGSAFQNRFGVLLAHPNDIDSFQRRYAFDISAPNDDRPLFSELGRVEHLGAWVLGAGGALGWLAWLLPALTVVAVTLQRGRDRFARVPDLALASLGAAQTLAFASMMHALAIWLPLRDRSFDLSVIMSGLGAALGIAFGARLLGPSKYTRLSMHAFALVLFALSSAALGPLFASVALHVVLGPLLSGALSFQLAVCAQSWRRRDADPTRAAQARHFGAALLGAASALPLASASALLAGYAAVGALAAASLALPTLLALRPARNE